MSQGTKADQKDTGPEKKRRIPHRCRVLWKKMAAECGDRTLDMIANGLVPQHMESEWSKMDDASRKIFQYWASLEIARIRVEKFINK
jgi:hypothetical protein